MVSKVCFLQFNMSHHDPYPVYEMLRWVMLVCVSCGITEWVCGERILPTCVRRCVRVVIGYVASVRSGRSAGVCMLGIVSVFLLASTISVLGCRVV